MGKIGKPQKKKKNKIKSYGWHKNPNTLNKAPKSCEQEVPRRLRELGMAIKELQAGKKSRNKFNKPDGPSSDGKLRAIKGKRFELQAKSLLPLVTKEADSKKKVGKQIQRMTQEATEEYINSLKPTRPLLENFSFKQVSGESDMKFLSRVEQETQDALTRSKIADKFEVGEKDDIKSRVKAKLEAHRREKKKQKLEEKTTEPVVNKEEKKVPTDFSSLQDEAVTFGEVAHAPPTLSVLPKHAKVQGHDRPGLRMPELKEAFAPKKADPFSRRRGESIKRKHLTDQQQRESDANREKFVEAYRQMKKRRKFK